MPDSACWMLGTQTVCFRLPTGRADTREIQGKASWCVSSQSRSGSAFFKFLFLKFRIFLNKRLILLFTSVVTSAYWCAGECLTTALGRERGKALRCKVCQFPWRQCHPHQHPPMAYFKGLRRSHWLHSWAGLCRVGSPQQEPAPAPHSWGKSLSISETQFS